MYDGGDGRLFYSSSMTKFPELIAQPLKTTCQYVSFEELVGTFWSVLLSDYNCLLAAQILCMVDINLLTENPVSIFPYILSQILLNKPALNSNEFKTEELFSNLHNSFEFIFRHSRYNTAIIGLSALTVTEVNERAWLLLESFTVLLHLFVILKDKDPPPATPLSLFLSSSVQLTDRRAGTSWTTHTGYSQLQHEKGDGAKEGGGAELRYAAIDTASVTGACLGIR